MSHPVIYTLKAFSKNSSLSLHNKFVQFGIRSIQLLIFFRMDRMQMGKVVRYVYTAVPQWQNFPIKYFTLNIHGEVQWVEGLAVCWVFVRHSLFSCQRVTKFPKAKLKIRQNPTIPTPKLNIKLGHVGLIFLSIFQSFVIYSEK